MDLTRPQLGGLAEWSVEADRTGLHYIQRNGTGRWYQPPVPWTPPADWLAAAHYFETFLFLTAPADSIPTQRLETAAGDLSDLVAVGRRDVLFGGIMSINGLA
ncbi:MULTISPECIES: hypothetical protein [Streptacidiphilus]|uniref:Uncharacterized protein n=1 Tax=Streptacidiphilus cavernicola TaxID=3342716 RepID=A0ABV6UW57_9ACTN|nr:hypothetical protein [Streptacidiphilus jeojiense]